MGLFQVLLDWALIFLIMVGKIFYWLKLIREDTSILMEIMKHLMATDILGSFVILCHDIPSYFLETSLSQQIYFLKILGTFSQCLPFFFALLMLPIFSLLNLIAIIAVYRFVSLRKECISRSSLVLCYLGSASLTAPLLTPWFGFGYDNKLHYWYYDYSKPYTALFQKFNITLQIVCMTIVTICMTVVLIYLTRRAQHFSKQTICPAPAIGSASSKVEVAEREGSHAERRLEAGENSHGKIIRSHSILDQGFAFIVLSLCFIMGTTAFNLVNESNSTVCLVITVITGNLNRTKWIIYCFLMRQDATISRLFR